MSKAVIRYWNIEDSELFTVYRVEFDDEGITTVKVDKQNKKYDFDNQLRITEYEKYLLVKPILKAIERKSILPQGVAIGWG